MKPLAVGMIVAAISLHLAAYKIELHNYWGLYWTAWDDFPVAVVRTIGLAIPAVLIGAAIQLWPRKR